MPTAWCLATASCKLCHPDPSPHTLSVISAMSSRCSQLGNMLVKVRGSRPAWIRYAFGGFFPFLSVAANQKCLFHFNIEKQWRPGPPKLNPYYKWLDHRSVATLTVLQHRLHGTFPVHVPANTSWASVPSVLRPPALPQIHLMVVVYQEQGWRLDRNGQGTISNNLGDTAKILTVIFFKTCYIEVS